MDKTTLLESHNQLRYKHDVPPLIWDDELADKSQAYAKYLKQGFKCQHVDRDEMGENILSSNRPLMANDVSQKWYGPGYLMDFASRTYVYPVSDVWSFPNMIWKHSKFMGCARECCGSREVWVCNYFPTPTIDEFAQNVLPPSLLFDPTHMVSQENLNPAEWEFDDEIMQGLFTEFQRMKLSFEVPDMSEEHKADQNEYRDEELMDEILDGWDNGRTKKRHI